MICRCDVAELFSGVWGVETRGGAASLGRIFLECAVLSWARGDSHRFRSLQYCCLPFFGCPSVVSFAGLASSGDAVQLLPALRGGLASRWSDNRGLPRSRSIARVLVVLGLAVGPTDQQRFLLGVLVLRRTI